MCSRLSPLWLGTHQERARGGQTRPARDWEAGRGSSGWGYSPVVLSGVAIAAGNAHLVHFVCQWALHHLLGWEREGSTNCTLET